MIVHCILLESAREGGYTAKLAWLLYDDRFEFQFSCGYNKPTSNMALDNKPSFINSIWLHSDDVRSPSWMFNVIPAFLLDSFVGHCSEHNINLRTLEEAVMLNWSEFITDCSGIQLLLRYC